MRNVEAKLPHDKIHIIPMGDLHIGSSKCDLELIKQRIQTIKEHPDCYCVLLGDLINNSTKTSVGDIYGEQLKPMEQMNLCVELFEPIKDKILAVTGGNHEARTYKQDGIDLTAFLCKCLGIEDKYDPVGVMLFITFGRCSRNRNPNCYSIYITHGSGGGSTMGGKLNGLAKRGQIVNGSDIIIAGHTHQPATFRQTTYQVDKSHHKLVSHETIFVNIASTLDYEAYAEQYGLGPSSKTNPVISLASNGIAVQA